MESYFLISVRAFGVGVESVNLVVITGGVSTGARDLVPAALVKYGASALFHKVSQKPGKPLLFAKRGDQLIFGLPGNPIGSHFCNSRYVGAALRKMLGREPRLPIYRGQLVHAFKPTSGRISFIPSRVTREGDVWKVDCLVSRGSADVFALVSANAYAILSPGDGARDGDRVAFEPTEPLI